MVIVPVVPVKKCKYEKDLHWVLIISNDKKRLGCFMCHRWADESKKHETSK